MTESIMQILGGKCPPPCLIKFHESPVFSLGKGLTEQSLRSQAAKDCLLKGSSVGYVFVSYFLCTSTYL